MAIMKDNVTTQAAGQRPTLVHIQLWHVNVQASAAHSMTLKQHIELVNNRQLVHAQLWH